MARQVLAAVDGFREVGNIGFLSILSFAHQLVRERVQPGETVIDATLGNGHDTLFLAQTTGDRGHVYGFDVQEAAVEASRRRLASAGIEEERYTLFLRNHAEMLDVLPSGVRGHVAAVMFNLGYLPGSDRRIMTQEASTLQALDAALAVLRSGGIITAVVYPGHEGGEREAAAVERWASELPQEQCQVLLYRFLNQRNAPPYVVAIEKR